MDNQPLTLQNIKEIELSNIEVSAKSEKMQDEAKTLDNVNCNVEPISDGTVRMERSIGLFGGIALILGAMMGSGIFVSPTGLLKNTGSAYMSIVVWAACGFLTTLAALSYCELGTVVPKSGGEHAYFQATFKPFNKFVGELPAFLYSWVMILLLKPSSIAVVSLAFGKYALYPTSRMDRFADGCKLQDSDHFKLAVKLLALVIASLIAVTNIISAKLATNAAIVFLIAKVAAIAIMVGIGLYNMGRGEFGALRGCPFRGWDSSDKSAGQIAASFYSGFATRIIYGVAIMCVIILRYTMPDAPRPFKVPIIIPITAVVMCAALVVLPIVDDPKIEYLAILGFFGLGVMVYYPFVYKKYRLSFMDEFTRFLQCLTLSAPSPYKED